MVPEDLITTVHASGACIVGDDSLDQQNTAIQQTLEQQLRSVLVSRVSACWLTGPGFRHT